MLEWISLIFIILGAFGLGNWLIKRWERKREIEERVREQILELKNSTSVESRKELGKNLLKLGEDAIDPLKNEIEESKDIKIIWWMRRILCKLGDEKAKKKIVTALKDRVQNETSPNRFTDYAQMIRDLRIEELGPLLHQRLKEERVDDLVYQIIVTLGSLGYEEALLDIIDKMEGAFEKGKTRIVHACIISTRGMLPQFVEGIPKQTLNRIAIVYSEVLGGEDDWSIEAVLKDPLSIVLVQKEDLSENVRDKLMEKLFGVSDRDKYEIMNKKYSIERLADLGDQRAMLHLKEMKEKESSSSALVSIIDSALNRLESAKEP